jgi:hypothetical protein
LPSDLFCINCGADLRQMRAPTPLGSSQVIPQTPLSPPKSRKNPWIAAVLNLFLPGLGYVYDGTGRDSAEVLFGVLLFVTVFLGFYVGLIGSALTTPVSSNATPGTVSPTAYLFSLLFLLPLALAYDGYHRSKGART